MNNSLFSYADSSVGRLEFPLAVKVIMIDLDGTLLSTADDLALSANLMLRELGMPEQSSETIQS